MGGSSASGKEPGPNWSLTALTCLRSGEGPCCPAGCWPSPLTSPHRLGVPAGPYHVSALTPSQQLLVPRISRLLRTRPEAEQLGRGGLGSETQHLLFYHTPAVTQLWFPISLIHLALTSLRHTHTRTHSLAYTHTHLSSLFFLNRSTNIVEHSCAERIPDNLPTLFLQSNSIKNIECRTGGKKKKKRKSLAAFEAHLEQIVSQHRAVQVAA